MDLLLVPIFLIFTHLTLFLDNLFFPNFKKQKIIQPVFIIGSPRSGTSFLHNILLNVDDAVSYKIWEIIFPSLIARLFLKPLIMLLFKKNKSTIMPKETGHESDLFKNDEEEFLYMHIIDAQYLKIIGLIGFDENASNSITFHDEQLHRKISVGWFKKCLQRQMYYLSKTQIIAQTHFSTFRLKTLLEIFPDAKIIFLKRSPLETIPSHLSLSYNILIHLYKDIPKDKLYILMQRRYLDDIELYRYYYSNLKKECGLLHKNNTLEVTFENLTSNTKDTIKAIIKFCNLKINDKVMKKIDNISCKQKSYIRVHNNFPLEKFNLSEQKLKEDSMDIPATDLSDI